MYNEDRKGRGCGAVIHVTVFSVMVFQLYDPHQTDLIIGCLYDDDVKYSGQDPQRLTCKKVPSPSSIREMSTLKLFKWLLPESPLHRLTLYCM